MGVLLAVLLAVLVPMPMSVPVPVVGDGRPWMLELGLSMPTLLPAVLVQVEVVQLLSELTWRTNGLRRRPPLSQGVICPSVEECGLHMLGGSQ